MIALIGVAGFAIAFAIDGVLWMWLFHVLHTYIPTIPAVGFWGSLLISIPITCMSVITGAVNALVKEK